MTGVKEHSLGKRWGGFLLGVLSPAAAPGNIRDFPEIFSVLLRLVKHLYKSSTYLSSDIQTGSTGCLVVWTMSKREADRMQGEGLEQYVFPSGAPSPTPFGLSSAGLWDDVEV